MVALFVSIWVIGGLLYVMISCLILAKECYRRGESFPTFMSFMLAISAFCLLLSPWLR